MKNYVLKKANDFTSNEIDFFKSILLSAKEVTEKTFPGLIEKNPDILILGNLKKPSGIGALKIPNKNYKDKIFKLSKSNSNPNSFNHELGWVVSLEEGNGNTIVKTLSNLQQYIYATVRQDNEKMIHLLKKYGFQQEGFPYKSNRGNYNLLLFTKKK